MAVEPAMEMPNSDQAGSPQGTTVWLSCVRSSASVSGVAMAPPQDAGPCHQPCSTPTWYPASTAPAIRTSPAAATRSEGHTSELQSLMRTSYAVLCLKKKKKINKTNILKTNKNNKKNNNHKNQLTNSLK